MMNLDNFEALAKSRRSIRNFKPDPIPPELIDRLIDIARWSPSGYNLQPTHFVIVTDARRRQALYPACLKQRQIIEAPALIVITGDTKVAEKNLDDMLAMEREIGSIDDAYEKLLRKVVPLMFGQGPLRLGRLAKAAAGPAMGFFKPMPSLPAVYKGYWLAKQTMLCAMTLMLAAAAAGLASLPMEGFDEGRVRKVLGIPRTQRVPVVIALGYAKEGAVKKGRLPMERFVHREGWQGLAGITAAAPFVPAPPSAVPRRV